MTAAYWNRRADIAHAARKESLALARTTGDARWREQARYELEKELEYRKWANEEADLERALFAA